MSKKILSFSEEEYTKASYGDILDTVKKNYGLNKARIFLIGCKNIFINYFPFIGHLPVSIQLYLKDNFKNIFNDLDVKVSTLSSALIMLIIAVMIGARLDGFDVGFVGEYYEYWVKMPKYYSYIGSYLPFLGFPYGFPKIFTQVVSYFFIISSVCMIGFNLLGKPLGMPLAEIPITVGKWLSERSRFRKDAEERIKSNQELSQVVGKFVEKERRVREENLSAQTLEEFFSYVSKKE